MPYQDLLGSLAATNDRIVVLTAENRAPIRDLPARLGPRFVDVGICEQTMVGVAAGLALRGRIPVAHALASFLTMRAFEFIRTTVGIAGLPVKLVGYVPGFLSEANGPTHQAIEDVSLMRGIPGMHVFCPSDGEELERGLAAVLESPRPCYVRYTDRAPVRAERAPFRYGEADLLEDGTDVGLLAYGPILGEVLAAAERLRARGISAAVIDVRMPKPFDAALVLELAARLPLLVTVEDHFLTGGLGSIVAEVLARRTTNARLASIALEERWFQPGLLPEVLAHEGFTAEALARRVELLLEGGSL